MRAAFGQQFDAPDGYLNTASIGMPPLAVAEAVVAAVRNWSAGSGRSHHFDEPVAVARAAFAELIAVDRARVAIGSSVSALVGVVAANLRDDARVLVARGDFTSVTFPFAARSARGITVTEAELADIPARAAGADLVAVSTVQSANGALLDVAALRAAVEGTGTRVLLDVTQAVGWLPQDVAWADVVVAAGYKWLLCPRGVAWMAVSAELIDELVPHNAGWYAGEEPWASTYGLPLRLATDARRLDTSPAWLCHVGAAASLPWLVSLDREEVRAHCVGLANQLRTELGGAPADSAIAVVDRPDAVERLSNAGVVVSSRRGAARLAFHLYNTEHDVRRAVKALTA